jgi:diguanylate cyclase (GGDEF)-like protein/PAS domain S-box-containing protein
MKKKITKYLAAIFVFFIIGVSFSMLYITDTTSDMNHLIKLHQVEQLRRSLVIDLKTVQVNLYTVHTPLAQDLNMIVENVTKLESAAQKCLSCHHPPRLGSRIIKAQSLINDYQNLLSFYITSRANKERMLKLKTDAARIGEKIIIETENMSHGASTSLEDLTRESSEKITHVKRILLITITVSLLLGIIAAYNLTRSVTNPVTKLLNATRMIASGKLGATIYHNDKTEFGELAENFNAMSEGLKEGYDGLQREILERIRVEDDLRESRERYELAARGANDGLWDWDIRTNAVHFSPRWKNMLGFEENEIGTTPDEWFNRIHPDDKQQVEAEIKTHLEGIVPQFQNEHRMLHKDGRYRWMLTRGLAICDRSGDAYRMAGSQTDITERKVAEEQLVYDAFHDKLTGLPNRALFMDRLTHAVKRTERENKDLFAVLFIDLDRFKIINDSLGHMAGDQLLDAVSQKLQESLRPGDTIARFGGDEFAILLEDIKSFEDVRPLINRIQKQLSEPFDLRGQEIVMTSSIGIAFSNIDFEKPEDLIRNSDIAMYQAKANGRDQYQIFDKRMYENVMHSMKLETDLRRAIDNDEFELYYQPIISLQTNRVVGFEALVRWQHPARGFVMPAEFIPLAEETGIINPLGSWILDEACRQIKLWQMRYPLKTPLTMSVIQQVERALQKTKIAKGSLVLEITETELMGSADIISPLLYTLKKLDIQLSIDDFGTGYSSLSYLHNFPIDALKIDRSFISKIGDSEEEIEIVRTITNLGKNLNMYVVAEGVETEIQLQKLRALNCTLMQGYLFSKPLSNKDAEAFLIREREKLPQQSSI